MKNTGQRKCLLCISPYRGEVEELKKRGVDMTTLSKKYSTLLEKTEPQLYQTLQIHFKKKHPPVISDPLPIEERKHVSFDDYADMLLQEGAKNLSLYPDKVSHGHVIAAKRTLIEEAKAKNAIDATKMMMMKFFRGNAMDVIQEGEIVDVKEIKDGN
jgi:hypothetical protein